MLVVLRNVRERRLPLTSSDHWVNTQNDVHQFVCLEPQSRTSRMQRSLSPQLTPSQLHEYLWAQCEEVAGARWAWPSSQLRLHGHRLLTIYTANWVCVGGSSRSDFIFVLSGFDLVPTPTDVQTHEMTWSLCEQTIALVGYGISNWPRERPVMSIWLCQETGIQLAN